MTITHDQIGGFQLAGRSQLLTAAECASSTRRLTGPHWPTRVSLNVASAFSFSEALHSLQRAGPTKLRVHRVVLDAGESDKISTLAAL